VRKLINREEVERLAGRISVIKREIQELRAEGRGFNCIQRNVERMLACVKMLELDISETVEHIDA
jgi:hypothetical protein